MPKTKAAFKQAEQKGAFCAAVIKIQDAPDQHLGLEIEMLLPKGKNMEWVEENSVVPGALDVVLAALGFTPENLPERPDETIIKPS